MPVNKNRWLRRKSQRSHRQADRLRELYRLALRQDEALEPLFGDYLETGCRLLDLPSGLISEVFGDHYAVLAARSPLAALEPGCGFKLSQTYALEVVSGRTTVGYEAAPVHAPAQGWRELGVEAYLGAPIVVDGKVYGSLDFIDLRPRRRPFSDQDHEFVALMAQSLGAVIARREAAAARRQAEAQLREKERRFEIAFQHAPIGMALVSPQGEWLQVNRALTQLVGYTEAELRRTSVEAISHPDDAEQEQRQRERLLAGETDSYRLEKRFIHKDGHVVWCLAGASLVQAEDGAPLYLIAQIQDISERRRAEEQALAHALELAHANKVLQELVRTDALTGLGNRRSFSERFAEERQRAARTGKALSLLLLDVDHFKDYNDRFGHQAGDEVLSRLASVLVESARSSDFLARYGGEEFVIILPETDVEGSKVVAERFRAAVAEARWPLREITASFGVTTLEPAGERVSERQDLVLLAEADAAMYRAKQAGRNRVVHYFDLSGG